MFRAILRRLTGRTIMICARLALALGAGGVGLFYASRLMSSPMAAISGYGLAILLMLSFPRLRSADLIASGAIWMTVAEFAAALAGDPLDPARWLCSMAGLGAAVAPMRVQRMRDQMAINPYRPLSARHLRRRRGEAQPQSPDAQATHMLRLPAPSRR